MNDSEQVSEERVRRNFTRLVLGALGLVASFFVLSVWTVSSLTSLTDYKKGNVVANVPFSSELYDAFAEHLPVNVVPVGKEHLDLFLTGVPMSVMQNFITAERVNLITGVVFLGPLLFASARLLAGKLRWMQLGVVAIISGLGLVIGSTVFNWLSAGAQNEITDWLYKTESFTRPQSVLEIVDPTLVLAGTIIIALGFATASARKGSAHGA